jgi:hypothetical protein
MTYWWDSDPTERYWVEITDREDVGKDLHCPTAKANGKKDWSYELIKEVQPGDIVFHYRTRQRAFIGASVVGTPLRDVVDIWIPHGRVGRLKTTHEARPGWLLPIFKHIKSNHPLTLSKLRAHNEKDWIYDWIYTKEKEIAARRKSGERSLQKPVAAPFQRYGKKSGQNILRGNQGYLTKMPLDFIGRWPELSLLVDELSEEQEKLDAARETADLGNEVTEPGPFVLRNATDYFAFVSARVERRSRKHEALVNRTAIWLQNAGATVELQFPIDLLITAPVKIIIEAKIVSSEKPIFAVRQAVGQLHEYRYFLEHRNALICILLDSSPGEDLIRYVEQELNLLIAWDSGEGMKFGASTKQVLETARLFGTA